MTHLLVFVLLLFTLCLKTGTFLSVNIHAVLNTKDRYLQGVVDTAIGKLLPSWNVTYAVHWINDSQPHPDLQNVCPDEDEWSVFLDTRDFSDCAVADHAFFLNMRYISISAGHCQLTPGVYVRPSLTTYIRASVDIFRKENGSITTIGLILENRYDIDVTALVQDYDNSLRIEISYIGENITENSIRIADRMRHLQIRNLVVAGNVDTLQYFVNSLDTVPVADTRHVVVIPLDKVHCPVLGPGLTELVCLHHQLKPTGNITANVKVDNVSTAYVYDSIRVVRSVLQAMNLDSVKMNSFMKEQRGCSENISSSFKYQSASNFNEFIQNNTGNWSGNLSFVDGNNIYLRLAVTTLENITGHPHLTKNGFWVSTDLSKWDLFEVDSRTLTVVTLPVPPFVFTTSTSNGTVYSGYTIDVLDMVAKKLNFRYTIRPPEDMKWGKRNSDGSWTGIIGEVARSEADIGAGPLSVTSEREFVVDFSTPYYDFAGIQIVLKKSVPETTMFVFATVFSERAWACWVSVLVGTGLMIYFFGKVKLAVKRKKNPDYEDKDGFGFIDSMWFVVASFTEAGPEDNPRPLSTRVLVAGFWFFCSIMMATYTGNLAASLTVSRMSTPVKNLDELAAQSKIKYSVVADTDGEVYFQRMANIEKQFYSIWKEMSYNEANNNIENLYTVWDFPLGDKYQRIWESMKETGLVSSMEEGIARALNEDFALFDETPMITYALSQECDLTTVGTQFSAKPYAFALPERSPLAKQISHAILELQSEKTLEQLKDKWWKSSTSSCKTVDETSGLTFDTVGGIFIITAVGTILGLLVLVGEVLWVKCFKNKQIPAAREPQTSKGESQVDLVLSKENGSQFSLSVFNNDGFE